MSKRHQRRKRKSHYRYPVRMDSYINDLGQKVDLVIDSDGDILGFAPFGKQAERLGYGEK